MDGLCRQGTGTECFMGGGYWVVSKWAAGKSQNSVRMVRFYSARQSGISV